MAKGVRGTDIGGRCMDSVSAHSKIHLGTSPSHIPLDSHASHPSSRTDTKKGGDKESRRELKGTERGEWCMDSVSGNSKTRLGTTSSPFL